MISQSAYEDETHCPFDNQSSCGFFGCSDWCYGVEVKIFKAHAFGSNAAEAISFRVRTSGTRCKIQDNFINPSWKLHGLP